MNYYFHRKTNYGALTDLSRSLNEMFGDYSGRTVSRRTAQGFRQVFNAYTLDEGKAEHIVHGGMIAAGALLRSENENERTTGLLLSLGLLICYHAGK